MTEMQKHKHICVLVSVVFFPYHQAVTTGLQGAQADAEQDRGGKGVVVYETTTLGVAVVAVQGQIHLGVAGEQHRAVIDLQGDGLNPAVHSDVSLTWGEAWKKLTNTCHNPFF